MKMIAGSILILAAATLLAPAIPGSIHHIVNATKFAAPLGALGLALIVYGWMTDSQNKS